MRRRIEEDTQHQPLTATCMCTQVHMYLHAHMHGSNVFNYCGHLKYDAMEVPVPESLILRIAKKAFGRSPCQHPGPFLVLIEVRL